MKMLERRPHSYDRLMEKTSRGNALSVKKAIIAYLGSAERILDIGCGTGEFAALLASLGKQIDGFDNNPAMVEVARNRVLTEHLENSVSLRCMGVGGMDTFNDSYYNAVVSILAFSELSENERDYALKHAARILKPDGLLVIADEVVPRKLKNRVLHTIVRIPMLIATYLVARATTQPIEDLAGALRAAGFSIEKEKRSHGDAFAIVVGRLQT
jgi:demethylmenaquinone methyltransferase/2-methoxy-6-polyprenyl-1,4-benzoquinol methylase